MFLTLINPWIILAGAFSMTLVAEGLVEKASEGLSEVAVAEARRVVAEILLPSRITGSLVEKYFRKALRLGVWGRLPLESRGLILALRRWGLVKSRVLEGVLKGIFLEIELAGLRGRALFYGALLSLREYWGRLGELVRNAGRLLTLGIFYLNSPTIYRFYG